MKSTNDINVNALKQTTKEERKLINEVMRKARDKKIKLCPKCNKPLTKNKYFDESSLKDDRIGIINYEWECNNCDENFFNIEVNE